MHAQILFNSKKSWGHVYKTGGIFHGKQAGAELSQAQLTLDQIRKA